MTPFYDFTQPITSLKVKTEGICGCCGEYGILTHDRVISVIMFDEAPMPLKKMPGFTHERLCYNCAIRLSI